MFGMALRRGSGNMPMLPGLQHASANDAAVNGGTANAACAALRGLLRRRWSLCCSSPSNIRDLINTNNSIHPLERQQATFYSVIRNSPLNRARAPDASLIGLRRSTTVDLDPICCAHTARIHILWIAM